MIANQVAVIGVGLIGGSLAKALKENHAVAKVIGFDNREKNLQKACELGVIDSYSLIIEEVVTGSDIVVLATPLCICDALFLELSRVLQKPTILTDIGSVKASVVTSARGHLGDFFSHFVPGHPIAGKEKNGVIAASADLFIGHRVILTPVVETDQGALDLVKKMWGSVGAEVVCMELDAHDRIVAATSHLPHIVVYALMDYLSSMPAHNKVFDFTAGGFADFTRIASSNPNMWHDICLLNSDQLLQELEQYSSHLDKIMTAIKQHDGGMLMDIFNNAKRSRDNFIQQSINKE